MKPRNVLTRFSDRVDDYVKYRPGYPPEVIQVLEQHCRLSSGSVIADIGSGPGNLARLFLANGNEVFAVEPNAEMRNAGQQLLGLVGRDVTLALEEANELAGLEAWELVGQPVRMTTRSRSPVGTLQPRSRMVSR